MKQTANCLFKILFVVVIMQACVPEYNSVEFQKKLDVRLTDSLATKETVLLFRNLKMLSESKVIFGQHDALDYGIDWRGDEDRSDVKSVIGSHPALIGSDFGFLEWDKNPSLSIENRKTKLRDTYERNGVTTFCWHYGNPVTGGNFYDTTVAVRKIIPGGGFYLKYLSDLDKIADFAKQAVDLTGKPIPIIFRPFHEFDGEWFWWGKPHCTPDEFKELWRTTVTYLRDKRGVKNFIYAFSPDRKFKTLEQFLERYPGDEFVDLVGMDNYWDFTPDGDGLQAVTNKLKIVSDFALEKSKLAALSETGLESIPDDKWWTDRLYNTFNRDSIKIAFVMVWRNNDKKHHYAPYPGHPSAENFVEFYHKDKMLFTPHMPKIYSEVLTDEMILSLELQKKIELIKYIGSRPVL